MGMEIRDKKNNLLALVIRDNEIVKEKHFATENHYDFQLAAFNLKNKTEIERHIHNEQNRNIKTTYEVLIVLEGELRVEIFDYELDLVETVNIFQHDTIALFGGGHGIDVKQDTKFIEVKQGPYDPETDKKRF